MGSKLNCAFCCTALATISGSVSAADMLIKTPLDPRAWMNPILIANTQIGLSIVGQRIDYGETTATDPRFSTEAGWLHGLQFGLSAMGPTGPVNNIYFMGAFTWLHGQTDYGASGSPIRSVRSGADIRTLDLRFGKGFDVAADWMVTPYIGMGYRGWTRSLSNRFGPFGYDELYEHTYLGGGVLVQWAATPRLVLSASGLIGTTSGPTMKVSYNGGFPVDPWTYSLGTSSIYLAGLSADYAITGKWHMNAGIDYLSFRYGASAVSPDGSYEPDSRTSNWTVKAGFGYSFHKPSTVAANDW